MNDMRITPSRTVVTSFQPLNTSSSNHGECYEQGDWVVAATSGHNEWIACALSNGEVQLYDQDRLHLKQTYQLGQKQHLITDLVGDSCYKNPYTLAATTSNLLSIFDIRQPNSWGCQFQLASRGEQALSVSLGFDGTLAAVGGSKGKIHFYDLRMAAGGSITSTALPLGSYHQSHQKEVNRVRFQTLHDGQPLLGGTTTTTTTTSPILVTAGEDGLACIFDTSASSEEMALKNVLSVQSPIRQVGFFGVQSQYIYCLTGSESLQLYHIENSNCLHDYGSHYFRQHLSQKMGSTTALPKNSAHDLDGMAAMMTTGSPPAQNNPSATLSVQPPPNLSYLVDCQWDHTRQELLLLAGTSYGEAGIFSIDGQNISPKHWLGGGHRGLIRAFSCCSPNIFVTVGEDARMCEWNRIGRQLSSGPSQATSTTNGSQQQRQQQQQQAPLTVALSTHNNFTPSSPWKQQGKKVALPVTGGAIGGGPVRRQRTRVTQSPY